MNISVSICKQAQPIVSFPRGLSMGSLDFHHRKDRVVFVMGAAGTGKSRLPMNIYNTSTTLKIFKVNTMNISVSICNQAQPIVSFPRGLSMGSLDFHHRKDRVVFVMGATGTGKSRLSIDLAAHFSAEIINSDKIQVYKGLDIVTNKVTVEECRGIPHHLLGVVDPNGDFTATDFHHHASLAIESILERDKVPIIAGGSNSHIGSLVNDDAYFRSTYECCFLWVDVSLPILRSFVSERVDRMVEAGMIDEVRQIFHPKVDYTRGIRRAIGVPEMDRFLRAEGTVDNETLARLLEDAIDEIKDNNYKLAVRQLQKIHRLRDFWGWNLHRVDATEVFMKHGEEADEAWEKLVVGPSAMIVGQFLDGGSIGAISPTPDSPIIGRTMPMAAMAAATH
ncbi:Adenylate isopentenyltransferase 5, chloroplastic [Ancistrocladus abbreviatus]